jgi:hypothetical protein
MRLKVLVGEDEIGYNRSSGVLQARREVEVGDQAWEAGSAR